MPTERSQTSEPCPHCGAKADGFDALMADLKRTHAYGVLQVTIVDGEPKQIGLNRTFKAIEDALASFK